MSVKDFIVNEGEKIVNGEPKYPDSITISIPKKKVLGVIDLLVAGLENREEGDPYIDLFFTGKLEEGE